MFGIVSAMGRLALVLGILAAVAVGIVFWMDRTGDGETGDEPFVDGLGGKAWVAANEATIKGVDAATQEFRAAHAVESSPQSRAKAEANLEQAWADWNDAPDDEDACIWVGRRLAYLGNYEAAIAVYTTGLERFPDSAKLLRHRGHRFVTTGDLDAAVADLSRADALMADEPDEIEPDGLPNARNQPTSTLKSNILYHLGLAHFLDGDFEAARPVYERCYTASLGSDDMLVATTHWLVMTLRRVGREDLAQAALMPIHDGLDVFENHAYHDLALMRRGEMTPERALAGGGEEPLQPGDVEWATRAFGVAHWKLTGGDADGARALLEQIVAERGWPAFGFLAARAELLRLDA